MSFLLAALLVVSTNGDRTALIDSYANEVRITSGNASRIVKTAETPVDARFVGGDLFVIARDAQRLERFDRNGGRAGIDLAADPAFIREAGGYLYVYSRLDGIIQEIDPARFTIRRRATLGPFASDFETDGTNGYLLFPRAAKLISFPLRTLKEERSTPAGAVPVDMTIVRRGSALSAASIAIADPAARRIWKVEGLQSVSGAFARGFVRGLLGLGLFAPKNTDFPTGIDRVESRGDVTVAFDSSSGTLYRLRGTKISRIATGIDGFALSQGAILITERGAVRRLQTQKTE